MGLGNIVRGSKVSKRVALLLPEAIFAVYLGITSPEAKAAETIQDKVNPLTQTVKKTRIDIRLSYVKPETIDEKTVYQMFESQFKAKHGIGEVDTRWMVYKRLKEAGKVSKEVVSSLMDATKGKYRVSIQNLIDIIVGEKGKALDEIIGKASIGGEKISVNNALVRSLTEPVEYVFHQETSLGNIIEVAVQEPPVQIANLTRAARLNNLMPKYHVVMNGVEVKSFSSKEAAEGYMQECIGKVSSIEVVESRNLADAIRNYLQRTSRLKKTNDLEPRIRQSENINPAVASSKGGRIKGWKTMSPQEKKAAFLAKIKEDGYTPVFPEQGDRTRGIKSEYSSKTKIETYNPDPNYFTCRGIKKGWGGSIKSFHGMENRFTKNDPGFWIGYKGIGSGYLKTEILYNGQVIETIKGNACSKAGADAIVIRELLKKGGTGEYEVRIHMDNALKKTLKFYIE